MRVVVRTLHSNPGFVVVGARLVGGPPDASIDQAWLGADGAPCSGGVKAHEASGTKAFGEFLLAFDRAGAEPLLEEATRLSMRVTHGNPPVQTCFAGPVTYDDEKRVEYRPLDWGLIVAARYRPPAFGVAEFGHAASVESGVAYWWGASRISLGAEIGYASCRGGTAARRLACDEDGTLLPIGAYSTLHFFGWDFGRWALGVGAGYQVTGVFGRSSKSPDPTVHGPRVSLLWVETPLRFRNVPRLVSTHRGLEVGLDLSLGPEGIGYVPFVGWSSALTF